MLSIIIPSYKDPLLHKTIDSLLDNSEGDIEIIPVLDGYVPEPLREDRRIFPVYLTDNVGMREAINFGVANARGEYLMRSDEHCKFGPGYDRILTETIEDNWTVTPRRYALNPETWEIFGEPIDHERLIIGRSIIGKRKGEMKFHTSNWKERSIQRTDIMIDEKTAMQGSCWLMRSDWWHKVIGPLQTEGYGTLYQDTTEMLFKTWQAGGKLMLNKNTWYAHKHRKYSRTHCYSSELANASFKYAILQWGQYYYDNILLKIEKWKKENGISYNPSEERGLLREDYTKYPCCSQG